MGDRAGRCPFATTNVWRVTTFVLKRLDDARFLQAESTDGFHPNGGKVVRQTLDKSLCPSRIFRHVQEEVLSSPHEGAPDVRASGLAYHVLPVPKLIGALLSAVIAMIGQGILENQAVRIQSFFYTRLEDVLEPSPDLSETGARTEPSCPANG